MISVFVILNQTSTTLAFLKYLPYIKKGLLLICVFGFIGGTITLMTSKSNYQLNKAKAQFLAAAVMLVNYGILSLK